MEAIIHGKPKPRKTFTELLPVTFPTAMSAVGSSTAATFDANVSGKEVPIATIVMAVTPGLRPRTQPSSPARSPMKPVNSPIMASATQKQSQPLQYAGGGTKANKTFHGKAMMCKVHSPAVASCTWSSSLAEFGRKAENHCSFHSRVPCCQASKFILLSMSRRMLFVKPAARSEVMLTPQIAKSSSTHCVRPGMSLRTTKKRSLPSQEGFGRILMTTSCDITPGRNTNSPSVCS
mmetsp:Transcript_15500/g.28478  ORF Transcript_15500/g.28478 Transcript_15500/m.28478 type:complete len:234 (-) Transcript_15500:1167-1868(-)